MYLLNPKAHECWYIYRIHLHSTMYLLNRMCQGLQWQENIFTFHYVSIKSHVSLIKSIMVLVFTFHYVSIKSICVMCKCQPGDHLHSTMYLLNPISIMPYIANISNLHSTMYLLNRCRAYRFAEVIRIYIPLCIY